jgi:Gpi18-like mannosyltransferase
MKRNLPGETGNTLLLCAIGICLVCAAFLSAVIYSVDGNSMVVVSESLVAGHGFTVPIAGLDAIGRHDLYYSMWCPLMSILALPPVAIGVFVSHRLGLPQHYVAAMFALAWAPILAAATALMVAMLARRLGATTRGAIFASLGFAFGTIALVYSRLFFADPLLALLTVTAIYFTLGDSPREASAAAVAAMLAVLARPTGIVVGPCLGAYLLCRRRPVGRYIAPVCGTMAGLLIYFVYNWARFAKPLDYKRTATRRMPAENCSS